MRVYLTEGKRFEFVSRGGSKIEKHAPSKAFVRVPDEVGKAWIEEGIAYGASDANEILAWDSEAGRHVTLDPSRGDQLEARHRPGTPEVLKEPTPPPIEIPKPFNSVSDEED